MKIGKLMPVVVAVFLIGGGTVAFMSASNEEAGSHIVTVGVPELSPKARIGEAKFSQNCVACHGQHAAGTEKGPPLIHLYYEPNHHGDGAFFLAAQRGVRAHHWSFGDMPAQPQISTVDMTAIVQYVRELQKHNGIF